MSVSGQAVSLPDSASTDVQRTRRPITLPELNVARDAMTGPRGMDLPKERASLLLLATATLAN